MAVVHVLTAMRWRPSVSIALRVWNGRVALAGGFFAMLLTALMAGLPADNAQAADPPAADLSAAVTVPLSINHPMLAREFGALLGVDRSGWVRLRHDDCNWVTVADLTFSATDQNTLQLRFDATAQAASAAFGGCLGPGEWVGQVGVELIPRVLESGLAIGFDIGAVEVLRPDGRAGLLGRIGRVVLELLVLPRVDQFRVDVEPALLALEQLADGLLPSTAALPQRPVLQELVVDSTALIGVLAIALPPAADLVVVPEPGLDAAEVAAWSALEDEFDGFLTTVILAISAELDDPALRQDLLVVLLDARHAIAEALVDAPHAVATDEPDPVRELFISTWDALRPLLVQMSDLPGLSIDDLRLVAFIAGGDAIQAIDALGPGYGIEISRDGLRRLARLLLDDQAPASFTPLPLGVDPRLRQLFPFHGRDRQAPAVSWWMPLSPVRAAAAEPTLDAVIDALQGRVARVAELDEYLQLVSVLLAAEAADRLGSAESRFPAEHADMLDPLVRATAWKESCWRQFTGAPDAPRVLTSSAGALGMMQINARVWRGIYDVDRLADDVAYNVGAGADILEYYFVDHALRRGEDAQPGGADNLIRATYAAYNGGPRHLTRYRTEGGSARLRAIDDAFWSHYQLMRDNGGWPDVASCFAIPR